MKAARSLVIACFAILPLLSGSAVQAEEETELKSESKALVTSLVGTAVPIGVGLAAALKNENDPTVGLILMAGGYMIGPSLGHFYARNPKAAWSGMGSRLIPIAGLAMAAGISISADYGGGGEEAAQMMVLGSLALAAAMTAWDRARPQIRSDPQRAGVTPSHFVRPAPGPRRAHARPLREHPHVSNQQADDIRFHRLKRNLVDGPRTAHRVAANLCLYLPGRRGGQATCRRNP